MTGTTRIATVIAVYVEAEATVSEESGVVLFVQAIICYLR